MPQKNNDIGWKGQEKINSNFFRFVDQENVQNLHEKTVCNRELDLRWELCDSFGCFVLRNLRNFCEPFLNEDLRDLNN